MVKRIEFHSQGVLLKGRFAIPSEKPKDKSPVIVMATGDGLSGSKSSTWGLFMERFLEAGVTSFVFDFAGLGYSEGEVADLTLSVGIENLGAAVEAVKAQDWVDHSRLGLLGSSFGGNAALIYAGQFDNVKLLGFKSPAAFLPEVYELDLGLEGMKDWKDSGYNKYGFSYNYYLDAFDYNTYAVAKNIHVPCLIVHGEADTVVPVAQSKRLAECLAGEVRLEVLPGVNHGYKEGNSKEVMTNMIVSWFREQL